MIYSLMMLLYGGPETVLPVASTLATIGGLLLLFWRHLVARLRRVGRQLQRNESPTTTKPTSTTRASHAEGGR